MSTSKTSITVGDVMLARERIPVVAERAMLKDTLEAMTRCKLGIACVVDGGGRLSGIFTDGDIRRMLLKDQKPFAALFADDAIAHATRRPVTTTPDAPLVAAVRVMEEKQIWDLPVVRGDQVLVGLLHLHPAVKALLGI